MRRHVLAARAHPPLVLATTPLLPLALKDEALLSYCGSLCPRCSLANKHFPAPPTAPTFPRRFPPARSTGFASALQPRIACTLGRRMMLVVARSSVEPRAPKTTYFSRHWLSHMWHRVSRQRRQPQDGSRWKDERGGGPSIISSKFRWV